LLVAQVLVGAVTIRFSNNPPSVAAHLGLGVLTFISLLVVWYATLSRPISRGFEGPAALALTRLAFSSAIVTLAAIVAAGYMSAANAGIACTGFPICNGWGPAQTVLQQIHVGHRLLAYMAFALVIALASASSRTAAIPRDAARLATSALVLAMLQIALGVATVASGLAPILRSLHQANGVLLLASLSLATYALYSALPARSASPRSENALPQTS
jgi:cytochrome c oxidase assembly protein subunit 15